MYGRECLPFISIVKFSLVQRWYWRSGAGPASHVVTGAGPGEHCACTVMFETARARERWRRRKDCDGVILDLARLITTIVSIVTLSKLILLNQTVHTLHWWLQLEYSGVIAATGPRVNRFIITLVQTLVSHWSLLAQVTHVLTRDRSNGGGTIVQCWRHGVVWHWSMMTPWPHIRVSMYTDHCLWLRSTCDWALITCVLLLTSQCQPLQLSTQTHYQRWECPETDLHSVFDTNCPTRSHLTIILSLDTVFYQLAPTTHDNYAGESKH